MNETTKDRLKRLAAEFGYPYKEGMEKEIAEEISIACDKDVDPNDLSSFTDNHLRYEILTLQQDSRAINYCGGD